MFSASSLFSTINEMLLFIRETYSEITQTKKISADLRLSKMYRPGADDPQAISFATCKMKKSHALSIWLLFTFLLS